MLKLFCARTLIAILMFLLFGILFCGVTGCYAPPVPAESKIFRELLYKLYSLRLDKYEKRVIGGDFNEIWFASEKKGENTKRDYYSANFRD